MGGPQTTREWYGKRPLLVGGLLALLAAAVAVGLPSSLLWCGVLLSLPLCLFRSLRRLGGVALCFLLLMTGYRHLFVTSTAHLSGHTDTVVGQVVAEPTQGQMYLLRVTASAHLRPGTKVALYGSADEMPALYDTVTARVRLYAAQRDQHHVAARGVYVYAFLDTYGEDAMRVTSPSSAFLPSSALRNTRFALVGVLRRWLQPEVSGVLAALCFGERRYVSAAVQEAFRGSGLSHLLVVSGLHLSVAAVTARTLLRRVLRLRKGWSSALTVVLVWLFALLVGTTPSVLRAAMMCTVWLVGDCLFCRSDGLNSLGLAATILLVANPYTLYNVSFQLSFAATAGVLLLAPRLSAPPRDHVPASWWASLREGAGRAARNAAAVSASALLFTLPIACYHYGGFPLLAIPANVLAVGAAGVALMTGWLGALVGLVPLLSWLCRPLLWVAGVLTEYLCGVSRFASPPWAWITADQVWQWLLIGCLCGVAVYGILRHVHTHRLMAGLVTLFVLTAAIGSPMALLSVRLTVLPAGDRGGVWLQQGTHSVLLVSHSSALAALQAQSAHPAEVVLVAQGAMTDADRSADWADTAYLTVDPASHPTGTLLRLWQDGSIFVYSDAWYLMQAGDATVAVCVDPAAPCPFTNVPCVYVGGLPSASPDDDYVAVCSEGWLRRHRPSLTGRETVVTQDCITFVPRRGEWSVLPWL